MFLYGEFVATRKADINDILTENWHVVKWSVVVYRRFSPLTINDSVDVSNIVVCLIVLFVPLVNYFLAMFACLAKQSYVTHVMTLICPAS